MEDHHSCIGARRRVQNSNNTWYNLQDVHELQKVLKLSNKFYNRAHFLLNWSMLVSVLENNINP